MVEKIQVALRESKTARWTALIIVAFTMLCGYYLTDVMAPLSGLLEGNLGWTRNDFGLFNSAYGWFNVFLFMLIIGGLILDKMGVRFTGLSAAIIMVFGTALKYWAVSTTILDGLTWHILWFDVKAQVFLAGLGFAIFAVGVEVAGITVSKIIVKWFKGKELALAMGLEMATARIGTGLAIATSVPIAKAAGLVDISRPILVCLILLMIGLMSFIIYTFMDKKLDEEDAGANKQSDEDAFKISDIFKIITNKGWWYIAILCVLFYSAVFPFLKYATDLMVQKFNINENFAGIVPSLLPFGTILLTPFFGNLYDKKGKGATIMIVGAIILIFVHSMFSLPFLDHWIIAIFLIILLGIGFSLVPSAMWPSVPKIIPENQLGTAYALIFWVQNWGLMGVPALIGWVLNKYCFVGYVTLLGTGFTTHHGQMVTKISVENQIIKLTEAGQISRNDSTFVIQGFIHNNDQQIASITTLDNKVISKDLIPDNKFSEIDKFTLPMYTLEENNTDSVSTKNDKKIVEAFYTESGEKISGNAMVSSYYNYTLPMIIFTGLGFLALLFAFLLKTEDKKKGYGLQEPNIQH